MGNGGNIFNRFDIQTGGLQGGNGAFATGARAFHFDIYIFHAEFNRLFSDLLGCALTGERRALSTSLETTRTGCCPAKGITARVGYCYDCIVERRSDIHDAIGDIAPDFSFL